MSVWPIERKREKTYGTVKAKTNRKKALQLNVRNEIFQIRIKIDALAVCMSISSSLPFGSHAIDLHLHTLVRLPKRNVHTVARQFIQSET